MSVDESMTAKELILAKVAQDGSSLEYAAKSLQSDKDGSRHTKRQSLELRKR